MIKSTEEEVTWDAVDSVAIELGEALEDVLGQRDGLRHID